jgi:hypothetical protein
MKHKGATCAAMEHTRTQFARTMQHQPVHLVPVPIAVIAVIAAIVTSLPTKHRTINGRSWNNGVVQIPDERHKKSLDAVADGPHEQPQAVRGEIEHVEISLLPVRSWRIPPRAQPRPAQATTHVTPSFAAAMPDERSGTGSSPRLPWEPSFIPSFAGCLRCCSAAAVPRPGGGLPASLSPQSSHSDLS